MTLARPHSRRFLVAMSVASLMLFASSFFASAVLAQHLNGFTPEQVNNVKYGWVLSSYGADPSAGSDSYTVVNAVHYQSSLGNGGYVAWQRQLWGDWVWVPYNPGNEYYTGYHDFVPSEWRYNEFFPGFYYIAGPMYRGYYPSSDTISVVRIKLVNAQGRQDCWESHHRVTWFQEPAFDNSLWPWGSSWKQTTNLVGNCAY